MRARLLLLGTALACVLSLALAQARPTLRLRASDNGEDGRNGTLRILQLTDLHYQHTPGEDFDSETDQVQATLLAAEQPDLVVFSGDLVSGFECEQPCPAGWFAARYRQLIAPVAAAGVPWALTLGNHDAEADLGRREIVALDIVAGGGASLTQQGPASVTGASNYYLEVLESSGSDVAFRIWFLDSMNHGCGNATGVWGCVGADTLAWVEATFMTLWNERPTLGHKQEPVSCPAAAADSGLFALAQRIGIGAIYSGHDHNDDYIGELGGVRLAFGRKTGYGSYGPPKGWLRGGRVIQLAHGEPTANSSTWIRQEDGSKAWQAPSDVREKRRRRQRECNDPDPGGGWAPWAVAALLAGLCLGFLAGLGCMLAARAWRVRRTRTRAAGQEDLSALAPLQSAV
eukprot:scaffold4.g5029.t1